MKVVRYCLGKVKRNAARVSLGSRGRVVPNAQRSIGDTRNGDAAGFEPAQQLVRFQHRLHINLMFQTCDRLSVVPCYWHGFIETSPVLPLAQTIVPVATEMWRIPTRRI